MQPPSTKRPPRRHLAFALAATVATVGFLARGNLPTAASPQTASIAALPSVELSTPLTTAAPQAFTVTPDVLPRADDAPSVASTTAPTTSTTVASATPSGRGFDALGDLALFEPPAMLVDELLAVASVDTNATVDDQPVVFAARLHLDDEPEGEAVVAEADNDSEEPEPEPEPVEEAPEPEPTEDAAPADEPESAPESDAAEPSAADATESAPTDAEQVDADPATDELVPADDPTESEDNASDQAAAEVAPVVEEPVEAEAPTVDTPSSTVANVIAMAEAQLGIRYKWGGGSPSEGFDCSGLVAWAWAAGDETLPHQSGQQRRATTPITRDQLRPGDLVFYGSPVTHVGLYVGNNQIIHAPQSGKTVEYKDMDYSRKPQTYGRVG